MSREIDDAGGDTVGSEVAIVNVNNQGDPITFRKRFPSRGPFLDVPSTKRKTKNRGEGYTRPSALINLTYPPGRSI